MATRRQHLTVAVCTGALLALTGAASPSAPSGTPPAHAASPSRGPHAVPSTGGISLPPVTDGPLRGRTIVVDPGHNGRVSAVNRRLVPAGNGRTKPCNTSGTASRRGASEHAFTWDLATRTATALRAKGARVVLTRPNDRGVGPCVNERAAIGNRVRADLVLSIHADGNNSRSARGFHVITSTRMSGGRTVQRSSTRYATLVRAAFASTGMPRSTYLGRGTAITPRTDIAGLNLSTRPAVMLEAGNMRHPRDARLLASPTWRAKAANALVKATVSALR